MKDKRIDLSLFGEGEGTVASECAAEHSGAAEEAVYCKNESVNSSTENAEGQIAFSDMGEKIEGIKRIAFLLGLNCADEDSVISELKSRRAKHLLTESLKNRKAKQAYSQMMSEAKAFSEKQKGFDIRRELSDRRFSAMLRSGLSVEEAWRAVHADELIKEAREEAERNAVFTAIEKIQLSMARPAENGGAGTSPAQSHIGVESLSGKGIRDILRRVENGAKIKF